MHTLIFANGDFTPPPNRLPPHDLLIAADGGAKHALRLGLTPDVIIGDLDSLTPAQVARLQRDGATLIRHPAAKDETDLELALDQARARAAARVTLYGLLGGRWDMTFANLLLLAADKYASLRLRAVAGNTQIFILRGGESLTLRAAPGETVSVLPLRGEARGLTYRGLAWPLENASLPFGSPRGVSNRMAAHTATIALQNGVVCVFLG